MAFFRSEEKQLAKKYSKNSLRKGYQQTEKALVNACRTGKVKNVEMAMKEHRKYEYALLYSELKNSKKNSKKKENFMVKKYTKKYTDAQKRAYQTGKAYRLGREKRKIKFSNSKNKESFQAGYSKAGSVLKKYPSL